MCIYILDENHDPIRVTAEEYSNFLKEGGRLPMVVEKTGYEGVIISTVFLSIDHNFLNDGPPVLFETMTFSEDHKHWDQCDQARYHTWDQAKQGHKEMVERVKDWFRTRKSKEI